MSEFDPGSIARTDQWLASLEVEMAEPLQNLRTMIAKAGGDQSLAHRRIALYIAAELEQGDPEVLRKFGMSYAAILVLLNRKATA